MLSLQVAIPAIYSPVLAQTVLAVNKAEDTSRSTQANYAEPAAISSFNSINIPLEMVSHLNRMSKKEILAMHEELQVTTRMDDNDEAVMTIKIWFADDHIKGYIFYAPLTSTNKIADKKLIINIPVQWRCMSADPNHGQHCSATLGGMEDNETSYKCVNWHLFLPPFPPPPAPPKGKKEHKKKSKVNIDAEMNASMPAVFANN